MKMPHSPETDNTAHDARSRLIAVALRLFAEHGYAATSTREICSAASVNPGAISYHFGDKAGLYRTVHELALEHSQTQIAAFADPRVEPREAWRVFFHQLLQPLLDGDARRDHRRLHLRALLEWADSADVGPLDSSWIYRPYHEALVELVRRQLNPKAARPPTADDVDLHRVAFAIVGAGMFLLLAEGPVRALAPTLLVDRLAIAATVERLADLAVAMVQSEAARRGLS